MTKPDGKWRTRGLLIAFALSGSLLVSTARSAPTASVSTAAPPAQPVVAMEHTAEAWLISTRCVASTCPTDVGPERLSYRVSRGACPDWEQSDSEGFFTTTAVDEPLIVFIHGNRTDSCDAIREGWPVYERLLAESGGQPFRFVIWSWPADHVRGGPRQDALVKAARSDGQSLYLAAWLERLPPEVPLTLIGYSFGARVIGGALHLAEGGTLLGRTQETIVAHHDRRPMRVMLVAAALDCEWLLPGSRNGLAIRSVEQMMVTRNCCDPVLRLYPRMRRNDSSSALGFAGPASPGRLTESGLALEIVPVECQVGRDHSWLTYWRSSAVRSRLASYAFLVEKPLSADE